MKKKIIHLSYHFNQKLEIKSKNLYSYSKLLYDSDSLIINFMMYRHLYYALSLAKLDEKKIILDLGCSDGPFLPTLNKYGKKIIGLDYSYEWLLDAKNLINYRRYPLKKTVLLNAEGQHLPFKDKSLDLVFCLETLEHVPNSIKFINEIFRILGENGELVYSIPIEIGISLLIRHLLGKLINFPRESYTLKELFINGVLKKPPKRINVPGNHRDFDWRVIHRLINKKFKEIEVIYSPFSFLKRLNPTVIFKVRKVVNG